MRKLLLLLMMIVIEAKAQIPTSVKDEINLRVKHEYNPSIVVGVYADGDFSYYVKGWQHVEKQIPTSGKTIYEIGSITKTFTALLLAQMINENKVKLEGAVQDHWPKPFSLVDNENQAVTFKHLATHTSGLPRLPSNLNAFAKDPYAEYDRDQLVAAVDKDQALKAGVNYAYSNFAVGLLGESLAVIKNSTYNDLIIEKVLQPLNLKQTYMQLDHVPAEYLAQGYNGKVKAQAWQFKALAGAGSIRSSIEDLLAYGVAHLESFEVESNHKLNSAMKLATTSHYQQGDLSIGLGWHINTDDIIWHNGATAGFNSIIMIDPQLNKVVAVMANSSPNNSIEDIAVHLMDDSMPMTDHGFPVEITDEQLMQFIGTFNHPATDKSITFIQKDSQLYFTAPKQPRQKMIYIGSDTFKLGTFKVKFSFKRNDSQQVSGLDLYGWGEPQNYTKVADELTDN